MIRHSLSAAALCGLMALTQGGCASPNSGSTASTITNVIMFQSTTPPPPVPVADQPRAGGAPPQEEFCPAVTIEPDAASIRAYSGGVGDSGALRNQISITNTARECIAPASGGGFTLKLGVEGRVLIGPAGSAGNYQANLRIVVKRGDKVVANRTVRVGASVAAGNPGADFIHVEEGIVVPPGSAEPEILIGLDGGGAPRAARGRARRG